MRSASRIASSTSFVISTTVLRSAAQIVSISLWSVPRVSASRAERGSSRSRILGSIESPRATLTRWRIPPESSRGYFQWASPSPTIST